MGVFPHAVQYFQDGKLRSRNYLIIFIIKISNRHGGWPKEVDLTVVATE